MTAPIAASLDPAQEVARMFTHPDGYFFARWGRPIAPITFGLAPQTMGVFKDAFAALAQLTGQPMAETDPQLGSNIWLFCLRDWQEAAQVPDLDRMIPELANLTARAAAQDAHQARIFRYDAAGAISACFTLLRISGEMAEVPADVLALDQAVRAMLVWGPGAFAQSAPLVQAQGRPAMLRPSMAALLRAAYDPVLPAATRAPEHSLRLAARIQAAHA